MELEAYHRALLGLCFGRAEHSVDELRGFTLYRELVRARFVAMAKVAFKRSFALVGEPLSESFTRYLEQTPPRSPFIREVVGAFAEHAAREWERFGAAPAFARDVLRFEATKWDVANAVEPADEGCSELDFDAALAINGTLRRLALDYTVINREGREVEAPSYQPHVLLVYRRPGEDDLRWYRCPELLAALLGLAEQSSRPLSELLPTALAELGRTADEALLEELAAALTTAVERGVILGSRRS